jgi:hypothetical protein
VLTRLRDALERWAPVSGARTRDPLALVAAGWTQIAGEDVAKHSRPTRLTGSTLTVTTRSNAWSHQLSLLSEEILSALRARLPDAAVTQLRFRVGRVHAPDATGAYQRPSVPGGFARARAPAASVQEAIARFRDDVGASQRAKRAAGWKECRRCGVLIVPDAGTHCAVCSNALRRERTDETVRLLFEAPWLGYAGTAALVSGLSIEEYEAIRSQALAAWWEVLRAAGAAKRISAGGHERSIASSYVILRTRLQPEAIAPATVRNALGDELHDLIYGTEHN